jgi:hypothetical protein
MERTVFLSFIPKELINNLGELNAANVAAL